MASPTTTKAAPPRKRGWLRRSMRSILWLLLGFAIFHRPILHFVLRFAAIQAAASQNLRLDLRIAGSVFTNLQIDSIRVSPAGSAPTPVRKIAIEHLGFDYSLLALATKGVGEFLRSYEMRDAFLELAATPSETDRERNEKFAIADQLNTILGQPAAYADRVSIENLNILVTAPGNETRIEGFSLSLDPVIPGALRIARLQIPGAPVWSDLTAATSYVRRNLFIRDLWLGPELVIESVNFDASQRAQNVGAVAVLARAFGGTAEIAVRNSELPKPGQKLDKAYNTQITVKIADIALDRAADFFAAPRPAAAKLEQFALNFVGEPELPKTWRGDVALRIGGMAPSPELEVDTVALAVAFKNGRATIESARAAAGKNVVELTGQIALPETLDRFAECDADAALKIDAAEIATLTSSMPDPITGAVNGDGRLRFRGGVLDVDANLGSEKIASRDLELGATRILVSAAKRFDDPNAKPLDQLRGRLSAEVSAIHVQTATLDSAATVVELDNGTLTIRKLEARRAENTISASGTVRIPADPTAFSQAQADLEFAVNAPQLDTFGISANHVTLNGRLAGRGRITQAAGALTGEVNLEGGDFTFGDFKAAKLAAKIGIANHTATIKQLALQLNNTDQIAIVGKSGIKAPFEYEGSALIAVKDLAVFQPLAQLFGVRESFGGSLDSEWIGRGSIESGQHEGQLKTALGNVSFGQTKLTEFRLAGHYTQEFAETSEFRVTAGPTQFAGSLVWSEGKLKLRDINLQQAKNTVLTGYVIVPLDPTNSAQPIAFDERIAANVNTNNLDIEKLLAAFGQAAPATGTVTASLVASGTLLEPVAHLKLSGAMLKAKAVPQLEPAQFDATIHYAKRDLTIDATLRQPQIQPLTVKGHAPLDLEATIKTGKLDPKLPIELTVTLPPSSLAFVPKLSPQVARIDGTAAIDLRVSGSVEKPAPTGSATIALKGARIANENVPAINAFAANLVFADDTVSFSRFRGEIGGGTFNVGGTIKIKDTANPVFDLQVQAQDILAKRDDSITVRAAADLRVTGPLNAGNASGTVFVTNSRFFKEIDILPIGLPGKPAPAPRSAPAAGNAISFPDPPLRDWKFDIAIQTKPNDPFLIRGNLANGAVSLDLRLGGTGLAPWLDGSVNIDKFTGSLPFTSISTTRGHVYFKKDEPFQPMIDVQAESKTRDYTVSAYIYGKPTDPQVLLTSEPPLSNSDIISLLATGSTSSQIAGNAEVLASRAAILAVQQLYRKIFRRGAVAEPKTSDPNSIRDRFQLELGAVDNRTGQRQIISRFQLTDHFYIVGDLDTRGGFTGQLKYLIRFR